MLEVGEDECRPRDLPISRGRRRPAIDIPDVAAAGSAAIEALEDAENLRAALSSRAEGGPTIPLEDIVTEYADDLAAYPEDVYRDIGHRHPLFRLRRRRTTRTVLNSHRPCLFAFAMPALSWSGSVACVR